MAETIKARNLSLALRYIVDNFGKNTLLNPGKVEAILTDLIPQSEIEINWIIDSINSGIMKVFVEGKSSDDQSRQEILEKATEIFEKYDSEKDIMIIAWGNSHETSQAVNDAKKKVLEMWSELYPSEKLYHFTVSGKDKEGDGIHPLYLGIRHGNSEWKLSPYPLKKVLKELKAKKEG